MILHTNPAARRLEELLGKFSVISVSIVGLVVIFMPVLPGWEAIKSAGETNFLRVVVGFLLLYVAAMIKERYRLKSSLMDLMESFDTFNAAIYGKNFKVTRETVTYLVTSLGSKDVNVRLKAHSLLQRLTGQTIEPDQAKWKKWWDQNQQSFVSPGTGASKGTEPRVDSEPKDNAHDR